jgi:hypothetical protein
MVYIDTQGNITSEHLSVPTICKAALWQEIKGAAAIIIFLQPAEQHR